MCVAFAFDVVSCSAKTLGMLVKSANKNWKKAKEDYSLIKHVNTTQFCAEKFDAFLKLCRNEENVDVRNMLSNSRKKS